MEQKTGIRLFGTALLVVFLLASNPTVWGQASDQRQRAQRGELILGHQSDVQNLDARKASIGPDHRVGTLIYSALLRSTSTGLKPDLAVSWEIRNPTTYVFKVRKGVRFHDGSLLTSADIKYTYDTIRDQQFGSPHFTEFKVVSAIETPDPETVIFRLSEPRVSLLAEFWRGIVSKQQAEADPRAVGLKPIGSGPYKLAEWIPNTRTVLEAHRGYFEGPPGFSKITFVPVTDNAVRALQVETGVVDLMWTLALPEIDRIRRNPNLTIVESKGSSADFVKINAGRGPLKDVRVRRAIAYGINRREIAQLVYFGLASPGGSPVLPASEFHETNVERFAYDPSRAKALLAEAGFPNGVTVELEHLAEATTSQYSQVFQNQLARVGIEVTLKPREAGTIIRDYNAGNFDMISFQWGIRPDPDAVLYRHFHSSAMVPVGLNANYVNAELDRVLDAGQTERDPTKRKALYSQAQKIIVRDVPILILTNKSTYVVGSKNIENLSFDPFALFFDVARKGRWRR